MTVALVRSNQIIHQSDRNAKPIDLLHLIVGVFDIAVNGSNDYVNDSGCSGVNEILPAIASRRDKWLHRIGTHNIPQIAASVSGSAADLPSVAGPLCTFINYYNPKFLPNLAERFPQVQEILKSNKMTYPTRTSHTILRGMEDEFPEFKDLWSALSGTDHIKIGDLVSALEELENSCSSDNQEKLGLLLALFDVNNRGNAEIDKASNGVINEGLKLAQSLELFNLVERYLPNVKPAADNLQHQESPSGGFFNIKRYFPNARRAADKLQHQKSLIELLGRLLEETERIIFQISSNNDKLDSESNEKNSRPAQEDQDEQSNTDKLDSEQDNSDKSDSGSNEEASSPASALQEQNEQEGLQNKIDNLSTELNDYEKRLVDAKKKSKTWFGLFGTDDKLQAYCDEIEENIRELQEKIESLLKVRDRLRCDEIEKEIRTRQEEIESLRKELAQIGDES